MQEKFSSYKLHITLLELPGDFSKFISITDGNGHDVSIIICACCRGRFAPSTTCC